MSPLSLRPPQPCFLPRVRLIILTKYINRWGEGPIENYKEARYVKGKGSILHAWLDVDTPNVATCIMTPCMFNQGRPPPSCGDQTSVGRPTCSQPTINATERSLSSPTDLPHVQVIIPYHLHPVPQGLTICHACIKENATSPGITKEGTGWNQSCDQCGRSSKKG